MQDPSLWKISEEEEMLINGNQEEEEEKANPSPDNETDL